MALLDRLSKDLTLEYGKGFSRSNLFQTRQIYLKFPKIQTLSGQLSWSHYIEIIKEDDDLAMSFYIRQCENENWSVRELKRQMTSMLFHRLALSKDKEGVLEIAQMNLYLNYFAREENVDGDNPPISIVLGAYKDHILVEYAMENISNQLFVSKYQLHLPDKEVLQKELEKLLNA